MKLRHLVLGAAALYLLSPLLIVGGLGGVLSLDERQRAERETERLRKLEEAKKRVGITTP